MTLLTNEERGACIAEADKASQQMRRTPWSKHLAVAIEATVLAKLREQEPVMTYVGKSVIDCGEHGHHNMEMHKLIPAGTKLFTHPAPIPEDDGAKYRLVRKLLNEFKFDYYLLEGRSEAEIDEWVNEALAAARSRE